MLQIIKNIYPNTKWIITGHSLGAALAEICTADLSARGVKINSAYLFASPSPGNDKYLNIYNNVLTNNINGIKLGKVTYNIINTNDLVPNSMGNIFWGRKSLGIVKNFKGPKSKSIDTVGLAHNMVDSYLKGGVPKLFGKNKSGNITNLSLSSLKYRDLSNSDINNKKNNVLLYIFIILVVLSLIMGFILIFKQKK